MDEQKALVPLDNQEITIFIQPDMRVSTELQTAEEEAKQAVQSSTLEEYQKGLTPNTLTRQEDDIFSFQQFLWQKKSIQRTGMLHDLSLWQGIGIGLLTEFQTWMEEQGLARGTINVRLSTIRQYCKLAYQAGYIQETELALILLVKGHKGKNARNRDQQRAQTRKGKKKAEHNFLTSEDVESLVDQTTSTDTYHGIRNRLIDYLLFEMGLRVSEIVDLNVGSLQMEEGYIRVYRRKVDKWQTHKLTQHIREAAMRYLATFPQGSAKDTPLFPGNQQGRLGTNAIRRFLRTQGKHQGIDNLSPHDARHTWATNAGKKTPLHILQQAGGWASLEMPSRYIKESQIANEGVILE